MNEKEQADIGDYLKVIAVSAVFLQSILGFGLNKDLSKTNQIAIGFIYNLVKYSAPAFIFGILFTNTRNNLGPHFNWKTFYSHVLKAFFVPFWLWSFLYLILFPNLQQVSKYNDFKSFIWQLVNGNAAPHLWYATMMLQFLILMPLFNRLVLWVENNPLKRAKKFTQIIVLIIAISALWIIFYDINIFHGPHMRSWYLFDRFFLSFILYGILGIISAIFYEMYCDFLIKWKWPIIIIAILSFIWINWELFSFGFPINLGNAPYYKPSMIFYDLSLIFLISLFAIKLGNKNKKGSKFVHKLASIAYLAYLPNVIWSWLFWLLAANISNLAIRIIIVYGLTYIMSFITAKAESIIF